MSEETELQDSTQPEGEANTEPQETKWDELDYDSAVQKAQEIENKNKQLFARLQKEKERAQKLQEKKVEQPIQSQPPKEEVKPDLEARLSSIEQLEQKRAFGHQHNLSPEETDIVFRFNRDNPKEALENEFVKSGLEAMRAQKRVAGATPFSSNTPTTVEGKTWDTMDPKDRKKNFGKIMENARRRR